MLESKFQINIEQKIRNITKLIISQNIKKLNEI